MSQSLLSRLLLGPTRSIFLPSLSAPSSLHLQQIQRHQNSVRWQSTNTKEDHSDAKADESESSTTTGKKKDPAKDRSQVIPVETSIRYLQSKAYKETYGDLPVWVSYRRNFKGQFAPKRTRKTCIRKAELATGNPCPICRDEYLVLNYQNVELLKQFISPYNGETLGTDKTGLCRVKHFELLQELEKAKDYGTIIYDVPFRDYSKYDYEALAKRMIEESEEEQQKPGGVKQDKSES